MEELADRSDPFLELRPLIDQVCSVAEPRAQVRIVDAALRQQADELRKVLKVAPAEVATNDVGVEGDRTEGDFVAIQEPAEPIGWEEPGPGEIVWPSRYSSTTSSNRPNRLTRPPSRSAI